MIYIIFLLIFLIFYTYIGYPLLIILLGKVLNKPISKSCSYRPTVTFMIAAYNEEKDIIKKIENSLNIQYPENKFKIVVVSDASSDETDRLVQELNHPRVELLRVEGRVGKTQARNIAMLSNQSEITIFSDATTEYKSDAVEKLVDNFYDKNVGMVTGHLIYKDSDDTQMGIGQKLFWKYESLVKSAQTKLGTLTGSVGCITAFRTKLYHPLPPNIIEDFTAPLMFIQNGFRVVYEAKANCFEETTKKSTNEWGMRVRVIRGGITGLLYAKKVLNPFRFPVAAFQLLSHKVSRWIMPFYGISLLFCIIKLYLESHSTLSAALLITQFTFYGIVVLAYIFEKLEIKIKYIGIILYFFVVNLAAAVAIIKTATTKLDATWETDR